MFGKSATLHGKSIVNAAVGLDCMGFTHAYGTAMEEKEAARAIEEACPSATVLDGFAIRGSPHLSLTRQGKPPAL